MRGRLTDQGGSHQDDHCEGYSFSQGAHHQALLLSLSQASVVGDHQSDYVSGIPEDLNGEKCQEDDIDAELVVLRDRRETKMQHRCPLLHSY